MTDTEHLKDDHWGELRQKSRAALHNLFPHSEAWVQTIRRYIDVLESVAKAGVRVKDELEKVEAERDALKAQRDEMAEALGRIEKIDKAPDDEHDEYGFNSCHIEGYNDGLETCQAIARETLRRARSSLNKTEKTDGC